MKKIAVVVIIIIAIISGISYMYLNYKAQNNIAKKANRDYESYYNQEIPGSEVATLINRAVNNNEANKVEKNEKGKYISNGNNSINIQIKFIDNDKIYDMETIYNNDTSEFMKYYNQINFKCTKIEHHSQTNKISYMYIEQITE